VEHLGSGTQHAFQDLGDIGEILRPYVIALGWPPDQPGEFLRRMRRVWQRFRSGGKIPR
jgi:hypothetical protein